LPAHLKNIDHARSKAYCQPYLGLLVPSDAFSLTTQMHSHPSCLNLHNIQQCAQVLPSSGAGAINALNCITRHAIMLHNVQSALGIDNNASASTHAVLAMNSQLTKAVTACCWEGCRTHCSTSENQQLLINMLPHNAPGERFTCCSCWGVSSFWICDEAAASTFRSFLSSG